MWEGGNHKWPTSVPVGDMNFAVWGVPNTSKRMREITTVQMSEMTKKNCPLGGPGHFNKRGVPSKLAHKGAHVEWPENGDIHYIPRTIRGVHIALERNIQSAMPHKWTNWQHNP